MIQSKNKTQSPKPGKPPKSHSMHSSSMFIHYKRGKFKKDDFIKMMS